MAPPNVFISISYNRADSDWAVINPLFRHGTFGQEQILSCACRQRFNLCWKRAQHLHPSFSFFRGGVLIAEWLAFAPFIHAQGLEGSQVTLTVDCPVLGSPGSEPNTETVGPGFAVNTHLRKISCEQFIDVLSRSTLGERRPVNDSERIVSMLEHADLLCTALGRRPLGGRGSIRHRL